MSLSAPGSAGSEAKRVLIVRLGSMGDIVHSLPVLAALKRSFPRWEVDWLVESRWRGLLEGNSYLSRLFELNTLEWRKRPLSCASHGAFRATFAAVRERHYDYALDLQAALKSAIAASLSGAKEILGFESPWLKEPSCAVLYTRRIRASAVHVVHANLSLAAALGAEADSVCFPLPEGNPALLPVSLPGKHFAVINPGAGWQSKRWPPEHVAFVCDALAKEFSLDVILNAGPGEHELIHQVRDRCRTANPKAYSGDLNGLIALLRRSEIMVGPDTGPVHLAAALGVPTVALFGPTDPVRNGPYGPRQKCLRASSARTSYRHSDESDTMREISLDEVLAAIRELLLEESDSVRATGFSGSTFLGQRAQTRV